MQKQATPRLPRCVSKTELKRYFNCSYEYLWDRILSYELLAKWGYNYEKDLKHLKTLGPNLTYQIYLHYKITDLDCSIFDEIQAALKAA